MPSSRHLCEIYLAADMHSELTSGSIQDDAAKALSTRYEGTSIDVRVELDPALHSGEYRAEVDRRQACSGRLESGRLLSIGNSIAITELADRVIEDPIFGTPAVWLSSSEAADRASEYGELFSTTDVLLTHVIAGMDDVLAQTGVHALEDHIEPPSGPPPPPPAPPAPPT